ncbi:MAG: hypothetical protein ABIZ95_19885, partial [Pyrinomonadaceae bacterium]
WGERVRFAYGSRPIRSLGSLEGVAEVFPFKSYAKDEIFAFGPKCPRLDKILLVCFTGAEVGTAYIIGFDSGGDGTDRHKNRSRMLDGRY